MRWSLRNQVLVPLIAIQAAAVMATATTTATLAARRSERQFIDRLSGVIATIGHARFPFTPSVLVQMRGLSGAEFVTHDDAGRVIATSLPELSQLPPRLLELPHTTLLESLGNAPRIAIGRTTFLVVPLKVASVPGNRSLVVLYPETSWRQSRWEAALPSLALGFGSLGVMVVVTSWIAHCIGRRIHRLESQVARIAEGQFQEIAIGREDDEVSDLSRSINRMCIQLREMRETILQSERTRLLAQIAAGLAHQLRNAITGARMSIQLHLRRFPNSANDHSLAVALRQLAMTEEQIKGLLSLGRLEPRARESCRLDQLLWDIAMLVGPHCEHARVRLHCRPDHHPIALMIDVVATRAAVLNLTLNAIEAAGPGGEIELATSLHEQEAAIEVVDSGSGPPEEVAGSLLDPFVTSKPEGVGLGLALANRVAEEHGGKLSWSRDEGKTRFRLTFPFLTTAAQEVA